MLIAYDGSDLANAAVRSAAELFPGSAALVVTVWEPGLGATAALMPGLDAAGAVPVPPDPEFMAEVDKAGEHHAAVVAREGARLARSLGLDAEPHAIPDEVQVADTIVDLAAEHEAAADRGRLPRHLRAAIASAREHVPAGARALPASGRRGPHGGESVMCRWNAYVGEPLVIGELLYRTKHGLIDQSLHARMGAETTNGDGFGVGWYGAGDRTLPARYRSVNPAWNDLNLRELADHIESPLFIAHIRAAVGSPVQQTNCHPFRHGRWLFVHNGLIQDFQTVRRDLLLEVDPSLFLGIAGSTDSELLFHLALTFGLEKDPLGAMERAVGYVESKAREHGVESPVQMTVGISDGEHLWAIRYSSQHDSRTLFVSEDLEAVRRLHPDNERLQQLSEGDRVVVSEPLADLSGAWLEVPESTALVVANGAVEQRPFQPR